MRSTAILFSYTIVKLVEYTLNCNAAICTEKDSFYREIVWTELKMSTTFFQVVSYAFVGGNNSYDSGDCIAETFIAKHGDGSKFVEMLMYKEKGKAYLKFLNVLPLCKTKYTVKALIKLPELSQLEQGECDGEPSDTDVYFAALSSEVDEYSVSILHACKLWLDNSEEYPTSKVEHSVLLLLNGVSNNSVRDDAKTYLNQFHKLNPINYTFLDLRNQCVCNEIFDFINGCPSNRTKAENVDELFVVLVAVAMLTFAFLSILCVYVWPSLSAFMAPQDDENLGNSIPLHQRCLPAIIQVRPQLDQNVA